MCSKNYLYEYINYSFVILYMVEIILNKGESITVASEFVDNLFEMGLEGEISIQNGNEGIIIKFDIPKGTPVINRINIIREMIPSNKIKKLDMGKN